jgi:hypothetical protein
MENALNEVVPVWQRVVEFVLERLWVDYFVFLLPLLLPIERGGTLQSYTLYVVVASLVMIILRRIFINSGPWGALRSQSCEITGTPYNVPSTMPGARKR